MSTRNRFIVIFQERVPRFPTTTSSDSLLDWLAQTSSAMIQALREYVSDRRALLASESWHDFFRSFAYDTKKTASHIDTAEKLIMGLEAVVHKKPLPEALCETLDTLCLRLDKGQLQELIQAFRSLIMRQLKHTTRPPRPPRPAPPVRAPRTIIRDDKDLVIYQIERASAAALKKVFEPGRTFTLEQLLETTHGKTLTKLILSIFSVEEEEPSITLIPTREVEFSRVLENRTYVYFYIFEKDPYLLLVSLKLCQQFYFLFDSYHAQLSENHFILMFPADFSINAFLDRLLYALSLHRDTPDTATPLFRDWDFSGISPDHRRTGSSDPLLLSPTTSGAGGGGAAAGAGAGGAAAGRGEGAYESFQFFGAKTTPPRMRSAPIPVPLPMPPSRTAGPTAFMPSKIVPAEVLFRPRG